MNQYHYCLRLKKLAVNSNGFTLIEVLIALVIVAISMLGIYELLNTAIDTSGYARNKLKIHENGFKTLLMVENFNKPLNASSDSDIVYSLKKEPTIIPQIVQVTLTARKELISDHYIFYEKR